MPTNTVGFQLRSLADLLQQVYSATDLSQISQSIVLHVCEGLPSRTRKPVALKTLEQDFITSLEDLYFASLQASDHDDEVTPALSRRIHTAETRYQTLIDTAVRILDRNEMVTADGAVLRAAGDAIAEAAVDVVRRRSADFALEIARDQEKLGAPPSLLFQLDGSVIWSNHALVQMTEHRRLDRAKVTRAAVRFAAPLCKALRSRKEPVPGRTNRRVNELGVHFAASVMRRQEDDPDAGAGETLLLVEVSEAVRATELSDRERQVAELIAQRGSYKDAAELVGVSIDSMRTYIRRIYRKMGVSSRTQLKARLIREGMLPAEE